ncbi:hypothetical protein BaRGS_00014744, partial [Batillaria attramentaria]
QLHSVNTSIVVSFNCSYCVRSQNPVGPIYRIMTVISTGTTVRLRHPAVKSGSVSGSGLQCARCWDHGVIMTQNCEIEYPGA